MLNYAIPLIERLAAGETISCDGKIMSQVQKRRNVSQAVIAYLRGGGNSDDYYNAIGQLLSTPEYRRLLLYLPLSDLRGAPFWFRETYLDAWCELLNARDARENFYEGDTYEVDARQNGQLERIAKCAHLTPWLIEAGYLNYADLRSVLRLNRDDEVLLRSFANTWKLLKDRGLFAKAEMQDLEILTAHVPQRARLDPLYVSEKRKKWLREREELPRHEELLTPDAELTGPFSPNIKAFMDDLESIQSGLNPEEIVLVTGSRLKGYSVTSSDWDVFKLQQLDDNPKMVAASPHAASIYFNALWLGGSAIDNLGEVAINYATAYFKNSERRLAIERLEIDLLQYRLLHKGFVNFYGGHDSTVKDYPEMDGNCPFYDDNYRRIATELFVKYVFIPTST